MTALSSRRRAWLLVGSLALNLFLLAVIGVHALPKDRPSARIGPIDRVAARDALPEAAHSKVDAVWAAHEEALRASMRGFRQARRDVEAALYADPFDAAALQRAHEALARQSDAARHAYESLVTDLAQAMPADLRRKYFEAGQRRWGRPDRRNETGDGPPPAPPGR
ncbi:MAG: periplasmic heavy metal sensor [Alphaproteobacteria bacterium]